MDIGVLDDWGGGSRLFHARTIFAVSASHFNSGLTVEAAPQAAQQKIFLDPLAGGIESTV